MSFRGDPKPRRHVNLSGRSHVVTRQEAIQKAREERVARDLERRQQEAAECILHNYRSLVTKFREKEILRTDFDKKKHDIQRLQAIVASTQNKQFELPVKSLVELVRECLLFFTVGNGHDVYRLTWVTTHLASGLVSNTQGASLYHQANADSSFLVTLQNMCYFVAINLFWAADTWNQHISFRKKKTRAIQYPDGVSLNDIYYNVKCSLNGILSVLADSSNSKTQTAHFQLPLFPGVVSMILRSKTFAGVMKNYVRSIVMSDTSRDSCLEQQFMLCAEQYLAIIANNEAESATSSLNCCAHIIFCIPWDRDTLFKTVHSMAANENTLPSLLSNLSQSDAGATSPQKMCYEVNSLDKKRLKTNNFEPTFELLTAPYVLVNIALLMSNFSASEQSIPPSVPGKLLKLCGAFVNLIPYDILVLRNSSGSQDSPKDMGMADSDSDSDESVDLFMDDEAAAGSDPRLSLLTSIRNKVRGVSNHELSVDDAVALWRTNPSLIEALKDTWHRLIQGDTLGSFLSALVFDRYCVSDSNCQSMLECSTELISSILLKLYPLDLPLPSSVQDDIGTSSSSLNRARLPSSYTSKFLRATILRKDVKDRTQKLWHLLQRVCHRDGSQGLTDNFSMTYVFTNVLNQMLFVVTDVDFFEYSNPFGKEEVQQLVSFYSHRLRRFCCSSVQLDGFDLPSLLLGQQCIEAYKRLYERHVRRPEVYTNEQDWLWNDMILPVNGDRNAATDLVDSVDAGSNQEGSHSFFSVANSTSHNSATVTMKFVLLHVPMVVPFNERAKLFEAFLSRNKNESRSSIKVNRSSLLEDATSEFQKLKEEIGSRGLKQGLQVTFVDDQGIQEAGIDGGGLFKEFIDTATKEAFDPDNGFFATTSKNTLYPHPDAKHSGKRWTDQGWQSHFEFMGEVLGKAVYEGILVDPTFAPFFLDKLLGKVNTIDDLATLDMEFYTNLARLKYMPEEELQSLELTFETTEEMNGKVKNVPLCCNGGQTYVNRGNLPQYLYLMAHYKLNQRIENQCRAFLNGFRRLIPQHWLRMFTSHELQLIIGGTPRIDFDDMFRHANFGRGYHPNHPTIKWLREVLEEMEWEDASAFLAFVTSCSRPPLLGFKMLQPNLGITAVPQEDRLPTASTCVNLLKLPTYSSKELLREKLLYAIRSKSGFNMS